MEDNTKTIAWVEWNKRTREVYYVAELKGKIGDWGYGPRKDAIHLSPYWQKRFAADQRYCGREAKFLTIKAEK
jgi:hypothetical protein